MQWKDVSQNWSAYTARILTNWPQLSEDRLLDIDGSQDAFLDYLAMTNGGDRVLAQMELADWLMGAEPADAVMDTTRDNTRIKASAKDIPNGEVPSDDDKRFGDDQKAA